MSINFEQRMHEIILTINFCGKHMDIEQRQWRFSTIYVKLDRNVPENRYLPLNFMIEEIVGRLKSIAK